VLKEVKILEYHTHVLTQLVERIVLLKDVLVVDDDFTTCRRVEQVEGSQKGALSSA
jgi:hypothetical protein